MGKKSFPRLCSPKTFSPRSLRYLAFSFSICVLLYFTISLTLVWENTHFRGLSASSSHQLPSASLDQFVFGIASSKKLWPRHKDFLKIWWKPQKMRGCVFVDHLPDNVDNSTDSSVLPPVCVSQDTSKFRYTYKHGYRDFIRIARIVSETVYLNNVDVKWYIFGDGDTVFFPENLVKTLSKYDHQLWYYIGKSSEIYEQNNINSFDMGFWAAGFALSAPLARALADVFDSCLERYPHLYGSDGRVYSCLAELGVGLTQEPGFHQVDVRGNIFGLLAAHPLTPLLSLSHLADVDPIYPNMTRVNALLHLFKAVKVDSERILQQIVCYDRWFSWTISISWGYAVEIFDYHIYLSDALQVQDTFSSWKKGALANYMFRTRPLHPDPCRRSTVFFLDKVDDTSTRIMTSYRSKLSDNCTYDPRFSSKRLKEVFVYSTRSNRNIKQLQAPRRQCCDVLPSSSVPKVDLSIRECKHDELIRMNS